MAHLQNNGPTIIFDNPTFKIVETPAGWGGNSWFNYYFKDQYGDNLLSRRKTGPKPGRELVALRAIIRQALARRRGRVLVLENDLKVARDNVQEFEALENFATKEIDNAKVRQGQRKAP